MMDSLCVGRDSFSLMHFMLMCTNTVGRGFRYVIGIGVCMLNSFWRQMLEVGTDGVMSGTIQTLWINYKV